MEASVENVPDAVAGGRRRAWANATRTVQAIKSWANRQSVSLRRGADVVGAAIGLAASAPVLGLAAIAMQLSSPGPVLFVQQRVGRGGRPFSMYKLRTMVPNAVALQRELEFEAGVVSGGVRYKRSDDPRIPPAGRWIRKLSIDELPQFVNVLRGDMSLIGPRPPIPSEVARYDARALRRLEVEQGLTCTWQVGGRSDVPLDQQVELDVAYVDRATLADDASILLRTIPAVVLGRGAY